MSCKLASSNHKPPIYAFSSTSRPAQTLSKSRISVGNPAGPRGARITAFYAPAGSGESLYQLLGVSETGSSLSDIKKGYKKMARKYHPDVAPPGRADEHTRRFIMVKEAYETLSNPQRRALYDKDLAEGWGFGFSGGRQYQYDERMAEKGEWKMRWQWQLDELKRRSMNPSRGRMS